ncbi:MAG: hypothetical protein HPY65_00950 [Syntrophaceae bacterium]|nr:hypothetical protein [Syntrophaceae bacterium]
MTTEELGYYALKKGDFQEAINIFRRALQERPVADAWLGLGKAYIGLEEPLTARWALYKGLALDSSHKALQETTADLEKSLEQGKRQPNAVQRRSRFRALRDYIEILDRGSWKPFFIKGINLGLGMPGYFPGEYAIQKGTYLKWFNLMHQAGFNALRVYTLHPPSCYEALYEINRSGKRLYLFQGIWNELPTDHDFSSPLYIDTVMTSIRMVIDAIYGNIQLPERPGLPHGKYQVDISHLIAGFIFGRETESCAVKAFNDQKKREERDFSGNFLRMTKGTPFEIWVAQMCDTIQTYESERYGMTHPVAMTNWPTLDPLVHQSESNKIDELLIFEGRKEEVKDCSGYLAMEEDQETLDLAKISVKKGAGFFASYHPYPYYPDFMVNDFLKEKDTYAAYLKRLKEHHGRQPIMISEFGVPSSREAAHWHRDGWNHGGHSEGRKGELDALLFRNIFDTKLAGGLLFVWTDEWFKKNWIFLDFYNPAENKANWYNLQDPEENYGLIGLYPGYPKPLVSLSGNLSEWSTARVLYNKTDDRMHFKFGDNGDETRHLKKLSVQHDEGFLYVMLETAQPINFEKSHYVFGIDTCTPDVGEFNIPFNTQVTSPVGLKFLIQLCGKENSRIMVCQSYDKYLNWRKYICPVVSRQGAWVMMFNEVNKRRVSRDGKQYYPSHSFPMSDLHQGSLQGDKAFHLADFNVNGSIIEIRMPWGLLNFTDPSTKTVLWRNARSMTRKTDGIRIIAVSYKPKEGLLTAEKTGLKQNIADALPFTLEASVVKTYSWNEWSMPLYHEQVKKNYWITQKFLKEIPDYV